MGIMIGESSTFPTNIYLKVVAKKLRAMRLTNYEKLTLEEIKELSREILIQRKVNFYKRSNFFVSPIRGDLRHFDDARRQELTDYRFNPQMFFK